MTVHIPHHRDPHPGSNERGIAFVISLMVLLLLSLLGMIILVSATGDSIIADGYRRNSQAFMAADAGIGMVREELRLAVMDTLQNRADQAALSLVYPTGGGPFDETQLTRILDDATLADPATGPINTAVQNLQQRLRLLGYAGKTIGAYLPAITIEILGPPVLGPRPPALQGIEQPPSSVSLKYKYTITSDGTNNPDLALNFQRIHTNSEQGVFNISINPRPTSNIARAFSSYGAFFGRTQGGVLASGTFRGPVHTNEYFNFANDAHVIFLEKATSAGSPNYKYWDMGGGNYTWLGDDYQFDSGASPTLEFRAGFEQVAVAQPPANTWGQERAVITPTGDTTAVSTADLSANLRSAAGSPPSVSGGSIASGVYVSSTDGSSVSGGGIYVQGNADDIQLTTNGDAQVITVRQGGATTVITITPPSGGSTGTTTIAGPGGTTTFNGVPMDKSNAQAPRVASVVYVNGNVNGLHGPAVTGGQTETGPAVNSALNITSSGDITITGDLKYQDQVMDANGDTAPGWENAKNVLGVFTNSGKISITPDTNNGYTTNQRMFIDAALMAFDEAALASDPNAETGGIVYNVTGYHDVYLRGSRAQSKGLAFYGNGRRSDFFDPRFRNSSVTPPFAPVSVTNTSEAVTAKITVASGETLYNTWQRMRR
ncbi:MAG: PilX N-terminal domain-containing pilus assembly protein [Blastocatellia bacterium]